MVRSSNPLQFSEEKCEELKAANEEQKQKEAKLLDRLHGLLDDVTAPFTHALLSKYAMQIEEILGNNRQQGEQIKKELWETQLDHSLNDEHFLDCKSRCERIKGMDR